MEIWKRIDEAPEYFISSEGRVKNKRGKILKAHLDNTTPSGGYYHLAIWSSGIRLRRKVHQLVAKAFLINNIQGKSVVNHKNGNQKDNRVDNLEWCTYSENLIHYHAQLKTDKKVKIKLEDVIKIYESNKEQTLEEFIKRISEI